MNPVDSIDDAATVDGTQGELAVAGPGAPLVAEFCVGDLAMALGMSTDAGRTYLGDAVEIRYRLPKIWGQRQWRAGCRCGKPARSPRPPSPCVVRVPPTSTGTSPSKAARCSFAQIERTVEDAIRLFDPEQAERRRREAADERCLDVDLDQVSFNGTVHVDGELDLADAIDLNDAITAGAKELKDLGCDESLNVRRSLAAGALARRELTLDLQSPDQPRPERKRELVIYVHLSDAGVAGVENTRSAISVEQVKDWCAGTNTKVTVRPVIDLNDDLHTDAYRPTETDARTSHPDERDLRLPALHPTSTARGPRPPRELRRHQHVQPQHRAPVPGPPPLQDPRRLDRRTHRTHVLHLDHPLRVHLRLGHLHTQHTRHTR